MRFFKRAFSLILALTLFISIGLANANDNDPNTSVAGFYNFPVKSGTVEWKKFTTREEKIKATQIPDKTLKKLSTEALVETVLNYPLRADFLAFDTYEKGFNAVLSNFNGLAELVNRKDAGTMLLQKYKQLNQNAAVSSDDDTIKLMITEALLSQTEITSKPSETEKKDKELGINSIEVAPKVKAANPYEEATAKATSEEQKESISRIKAIMKEFNRIHGAPDYAGGSGIYRTIYILSENPAVSIMFMEGAITLRKLDPNDPDESIDVDLLKNEVLVPHPSTSPKVNP